jgi:hypothetical protein
MRNTAVSIPPSAQTGDVFLLTLSGSAWENHEARGSACGTLAVVLAIGNETSTWLADLMGAIMEDMMGNVNEQGDMGQRR